MENISFEDSIWSKDLLLTQSQQKYHTDIKRWKRYLLPGKASLYHHREIYNRSPVELTEPNRTHSKRWSKSPQNERELHSTAGEH